MRCLPLPSQRARASATIAFDSGLYQGAFENLAVGFRRDDWTTAQPIGSNKDSHRPRMKTVLGSGKKRTHLFKAVEYNVTEMGQSLRKPVSASGYWALENLTMIDAARETYYKAVAK